MADYSSVVSPATEISLAPVFEVDFYTLEMAEIAMNIVEDHIFEYMDWAHFGVGGPA